MTSSKISVIIVADELLFRLGLAALLGENDRIDVVGVSDGQSDLIELCVASSVDVVVMDMQLSKTDGIDLIRSITSSCPRTHTLVLMSTADWRVRPAMTAGATGVLLRETSPQAIMPAIESVHLGGRVLCNEAARSLLDDAPLTRLTQRESDVLQLVAQGAGNAEIARRLQLGEKTVRNYCQPPVPQARSEQTCANRDLRASGRYLPGRPACSGGINPGSLPSRQSMNEQPINLQVSVREIWRRRLLIVVVALVCGLVTVAYGITPPNRIDRGCLGSAPTERPIKFERADAVGSNRATDRRKHPCS